MEKFKNEDVGVEFKIPKRPKVGALLRYWSALSATRNEYDMFERYWKAAVLLIADLKCDYLTAETDLDEIDDIRAVEAVKYIGLTTWVFIQELEGIPKNS